MRTIIIEKGQEVQPQQYKWEKDIEKVIIAEGATIGYGVFMYCMGITEVNIAKDATIGERAISYCIGITEVNIAKGATIGYGAFSDGTGITEVNIAKDVAIGMRAFSNCTGITRVNIAEGVIIGKYAFRNCTGITEVNIAEGVTISSCAFEGCTGITKLNIAEGVRVDGKPFNFNTVECFLMLDPIDYFARQLLLSVSELVKRLREKGHEEFNMHITNGGLVAHQGVHSLQSLCVKTIVRSDRIKDLPMVKSIIRSQKLLASEATKKQRLFILERNDQCAQENSKAKELYAMISE